MSNEGKRQSAMQWWNNLSPLRKTQICDTNTTIVGTVRRWETLTGREIESLWVSEAMTNEYNAVEKLHEKALKTAQRAYSSESNNDLDVFTKAHESVTKEVSMSFAEWTYKHRYYRVFGDNGDMWGNSSISQKYTTSELYDLYITKHLNK